MRKTLSRPLGAPCLKGPTGSSVQSLNRHCRACLGAWPPSPVLNNVTPCHTPQRCGGQVPREAQTQGSVCDSVSKHLSTSLGQRARQEVQDQTRPRTASEGAACSPRARAQPRGVGRGPEAPRGPGADFSGQGKGRARGHPRSKAWGGKLL